jgi:tetratricopeptide (TPR) repeat protein
MSRHLQDSVDRQIKKTYSLIEKGKYSEALRELEKAEETAKQVKADEVFLHVQTIKGQLMCNLGAYEEALKIISFTLKTSEELLSTDSNNKLYQSIFHMNLDSIGTLGILFNKNGCFFQAENCYELHLSISLKLLKKDPENVTHQSGAAKTLNNLSMLLPDMDRIEEAKDMSEKALDIYEKILKRDPENVTYQLDVAMGFQNLGRLLSEMERVEEAKDMSEKALNIYEKLLNKDPENATYQTFLGGAFNNLGKMFEKMELVEEAKRRFEKALDIYEKLLKKEPEDVWLQSLIAASRNNFCGILVKEGKMTEAKAEYQKTLDLQMEVLKTDPDNLYYQTFIENILNDLGDLLIRIGEVREAKKAYEQALNTYTKDYDITRKRKSRSIVGLATTDLLLARDEIDHYKKMTYIKNIVTLCRKHNNLFSLQGLEDERKMLVGTGLYAYLQFISLNIKVVRNLDEAIDKYCRSILSLEKLESEENSLELKKLFTASKTYLEGRCLITEALKFETPDLERIKKAIDKFRASGSILEQANVCYTIYKGFLQIIESIEFFEKQNIAVTDARIDEVISSLPLGINRDIKLLFEKIIAALTKKDLRGSKEISLELNDLISNIDSFALRKMFNHTTKKLCEYKEEPFRPYCTYKNWKLTVQFEDPEKVKGKLTIKAGNTIVFDRGLTSEEIRHNLIEIDYIIKKYIPKNDEELIFIASGHKKHVTKSIDYFEKIDGNNKTRILTCDCYSNFCADRDLRIAAIQLKYHVFKENSVIKISTDDNYHKKVMAILEALKYEADIIVFPEYSIPFDYLGEIQKFVDENRILVIAGSHYVTEKNLGSYGNLFFREFTEEDLMKNISPMIIPDSKIVHNEKYLGASIERSSFFEEGMEIGKINHILKLREGLSVGVMICYEFLNTEYRHRLVPVCDVILVPQTNPDTKSFYDDAWNDIDRPLCGGTKHFIIANGIFTYGNDKKVQGGNTGTVSTLNKHLNERRKEGIVAPINGVMEQFVLIAKINTNYFPGQDTQNAQEAVIDRLIQIFEESELLNSSIDNKGSKPEGEDFIKFLKSIETCGDKTELKNVLENAQKEIYETRLDGRVTKKSLIEFYSPLMNNRIQKMENFSLEKMKKRCRFLLIPKD